MLTYKQILHAAPSGILMRVEQLWVPQSALERYKP